MTKIFKVPKAAIVPLAGIILLSGCDKFGITVNPEEIMLYSEGTAQITTNVDKPTFSVEDDFYASVSQSGLVTADKVGETAINVSDGNRSKSIPITVIPQYVLYPELDGLVGKSESAVSSALGTPTKTNEKSWAYQELTEYATVVVNFDNGKATDLVALVRIKYATMLAESLVERYAVAGMLNNYYFCLNHDKDVVITLTLYNLLYYGVVYLPYTKTKSSDESPTIDYEFLKDLDLLLE